MSYLGGRTANKRLQPTFRGAGNVVANIGVRGRAPRRRLKRNVRHIAIKYVMELYELRQALQQSWGADTVFGEWDEQHPSAGQCAVTALIIQDYVGGDLLRCSVHDGSSHYWNRLPNGDELDFTEDQFTERCFPLREQPSIRDRQHVLSGYDTESRYQLLSQRVKKLLNTKKEMNENMS